MTMTLKNKTDLHLHLDGSLSEAVVRQLLLEEGISLANEEILSRISVSPGCRNLVEYLNCFDLPTRLLQSERALTLSCYDLICRLEGQGLAYAEIRFAPQQHIRTGMKQEQAIRAVQKGVSMARANGLNIRIGLILCMMVNGPYEVNRETAELSAAFLGKDVVGLDLAGPEGAVPIETFEPLFRAANQAGVPLTIHAGECGSYTNIEKAVSYGARRIGHGCAARLSEDCMRMLEREHIVLELCPTSNLQTRAVPSIEEHPIRMFFDRGILVTVNTDNMTVSGTSLEQEYQLLQNCLHFTDAELQQMNDIALRAAFLPEASLQ